jgi:hypothetical protein
MAFEWNFIPNLITAMSGLVGVWLGGHLTSTREAVRETDRIKKESSYLAILVVAHLDRFVDGCVSVSFDDGTSEGRPAGTDGVYHEATVKAPTFDPLALNVHWKVLPADLMYSVLNLPYRAEQLANHIGGVWEFDDPPDYTETFWTRQQGYALLGLEVSALAQRLRQHAGLPPDTPVAGDWNRDDALREQVSKIEKARAAYEASIAAHAPDPSLPS